MTGEDETNYELKTTTLGALAGISAAELACFVVGAAVDLDISGVAQGSLNFAGALAGGAVGRNLGYDHDRLQRWADDRSTFIVSDPVVDQRHREYVKLSSEEKSARLTRSVVENPDRPPTTEDRNAPPPGWSR